jgi:hypothetical protein
MSTQEKLTSDLLGMDFLIMMEVILWKEQINWNRNTMALLQEEISEAGVVAEEEVALTDLLGEITKDMATGV